MLSVSGFNRRLSALLVVLVALAGLTVASISTAAPARAGGCYLGRCGTIINNGGASYGFVMTLRNWCNGSVTRWDTRNGAFCNTSGNYVEIFPGHSTPSGQDFDGFEIAGGCNGYATIDTYNLVNTPTGGSYWVYGSSQSYPIDRRGNYGLWFKVETNQVAHVSQVC